MLYVVFFFKQKTAYEMRISDWSSDVCSSDLFVAIAARESVRAEADQDSAGPELQHARLDDDPCRAHGEDHREDGNGVTEGNGDKRPHRSEEHTSELQSLMRTSYAVFCLKKKNKQQ